MRRLALALAALAGLLTAGCQSLHRAAPRPGLTYVGSKPVTVQARLLGNVLVVETKWDKFGPYRFVIDTGSSVTLVSPELAARYSVGELPPSDEPRVRVRSVGGASQLLAPVTLKKIQLGSARFEDVPSLIYDCSDLSAQLGVRIDGVLGFPLFRNTVLTLDYLHEKIVLRVVDPGRGPAGRGDPLHEPRQDPADRDPPRRPRVRGPDRLGQQRGDGHQPVRALARSSRSAPSPARPGHPRGRPAVQRRPAGRHPADGLLRHPEPGRRGDGRALVAGRRDPEPLHRHLRRRARRRVLPARPGRQPRRPRRFGARG